MTQAIFTIALDGGLIRSHLWHEALFRAIKQRPFIIFLLPFWLLSGRDHMENKLAAWVEIDPCYLPYNANAVQALREAQEQGKRLRLVSSAPRRWVAAIEAHLGLVNADDSLGDTPIAPLELGMRRLGTNLSACIRAMRPHQWAKNTLVFLPLLAAHQIANGQALLLAILAFASYGLCASSVYVLNDLLDLEADRAHPRKRKRPFAAGDISLMLGAAMVPMLLGASVGIALMLPPAFLAVLASYYLTTLAYSLWLKRLVVFDVIALAGLYTSRIIAGAAATSIIPSFWLLALSMFLFLSLALVKRYSELYAMRQSEKKRASGRGYEVDDLPLLMSLGNTSGLLSVLVLALYVNSPDVHRLYSHAYLLWLALPILLFWVCRVWMKTHRGEMHDDPVVFAARDRVSLICGVLMAFVAAAASWPNL